MHREEQRRNEFEREYILQEKERLRIHSNKARLLRHREKVEMTIIALFDFIAGIFVVIFIMAGSLLDHNSWIPALFLILSMIYLVLYGVWRGVFM